MFKITLRPSKQKHYKSLLGEIYQNVLIYRASLTVSPSVHIVFSKYKHIHSEKNNCTVYTAEKRIVIRSCFLKCEWERKKKVLFSMNNGEWKHYTKSRLWSLYASCIFTFQTLLAECRKFKHWQILKAKVDHFSLYRLTRSNAESKKKRHQ